MFKLVETLVLSLVAAALVVFIAITIVVLVDVTAKKYPACERKAQWTLLID
jgi:hypothetical protein